MSKFFSSQGKTNLDQTNVRISAENGLSFEPGQTIGIFIPPSVKYFSGKDSYLQFNVKLKNDITFAPTRLALDSGIGANALISSIRVYAGNREQLLEENTEYPSYVAVKYDYSRTDTEQNKRCLTEGCGAWTPDTKGTRGTTKSIGNNYMHSPLMHSLNTGEGEAHTDDITTTWSNEDFLKAKVTLPLHCGCFADNEKIFPALLTNGVYVELTLAQPRNIFRQMDGAIKDRRPRLNPIFQGVDAGGTSLQKTNGNTATSIFLQVANSQVTPAQCVFVKGEKINLGLISDAGDTSAVLSAHGEVEDIKYTTGLIELTLKAPGVTQTAATDITSGNWFVYSESCLKGGVATSWAATYEVTDVEMIMHQITMTPEYEKNMLSDVREGGAVEFDIPSVVCQTHSTLKTDYQASIPLNLEYSRCKSVLCVPTDATIYSQNLQTCGAGTSIQTEDHALAGYVEDGIIKSNRTGLEGCSNCLTAYSFWLNGRQVPSRDISTEKATNKGGGMDANYLIELEKALVTAGIKVQNFSEYNRNFVVGRMLAHSEDAVFDGRGRSCRLNVRYEGLTAETQPSVNMLWKNFIFHLRKLVIKGDTIMVEV